MMQEWEEGCMDTCSANKLKVKMPSNTMSCRQDEGSDSDYEHRNAWKAVEDI